MYKVKIMPKTIFNARIQKGENVYYIGQIEEMPEVISQGKTIERKFNGCFQSYY